MSVDFKAKQHEFTQYIRNPLSYPLPADVKPERMAMYRELIFNNIDGFLAGNFPVIRKILSDEQWYELAQDFFHKHQSKTPYFAEIAEEFLDYLENERDNPDDFPFLLELAHYEWVEMALSIAKEEVRIIPVTIPDLLEQRIKLSPLAWPLVYRFPVHLISPEFIPDAPSKQLNCLIVYRDRNDEIKFNEINPMTYRLLELIQSEECLKSKSYLDRIAVEFSQVNPETIKSGGLKILQELTEKSIVLLDS